MKSLIDPIFCCNERIIQFLLIGMIICFQLSGQAHGKHHNKRTSDATNTSKTRELLKTDKAIGSRKKYTDMNNSTISPVSTSTSQPASPNFVKPPQRSQVIVSTKAGKVRGKWIDVQVQSNTKKVAIFLGIPYGKAPIGKLRFKKSHPVRKWRGIRNALKYPPTCFQWRDNTFGEGYPGTEMWNPNTNLSEDCLYLNIWTPIKHSSSSEVNNLKRKYPLPVMVWIYGGGFYSGTSSLDVYDGKWLAANEQVIVVSFNYRVAGFGFLSFGVKEAPGNAGLWDQNLVLKWVQRNIRQFGGDENRVTLFGESAGAASVSAHILSNHSRGLFRNAILQSASILSPWAVHPESVMHARAKRLANLLGCGEENGNRTRTEKEMITCLYRADPQKFVDEEISMEDVGTAQFQNAVVIDGHFLSEEELWSLKNGQFSTQVNILLGFNANEGNYFLVYGSPGFNIKLNNNIDYSQYSSGLSRALRIFSKRIEPNKFPPLAQVQIDAINFEFTDYEATKKDEKTCEPDTINKICKKTADKDLEREITRKNYKAVLDHVVGETSFVCPTINFIRKILSHEAASNSLPSDTSRKAGKKYLYQFLHRSSQTPWPEWMGGLHGYEIEFVFGIPQNASVPYTAEEIKLSRQMMMYWANFARNGDPNVGGHQPTKASETNLVHWPEYTMEKQQSFVLSIEPASPGEERMEVTNYVEEKTKARHCAFWRSYFPEIRNKYEQYQNKDVTCITRASRSPLGNSGPGRPKQVLSICLLSAFLAFHALQVTLS